VTDSYLPTIGGAERAVQGLALQRVKEGHSPLILTATHPQAPNDETASGVPIMRRPMSTQRIPLALADPHRPFHATLPDPLFMKAVREAIRVHSPDVIHCHGWSRYSVIPVALRFGIPVVGTAHDYGFGCAVKHGTMPDGTTCTGPSLGKCLKHSTQHYGAKGIPVSLGMRAMARSQRNSMSVSGISQPVRDFGLGTGYAMPGMQAIPSFIPDEALTINPDVVPEWLPKTPYIMFAGALSVLKGVPVLIEAHRTLRESRGLDIELVLVGTQQPDTPPLDFPRVTVKTDVPHQEVMAAWKSAEVAVVPSVLAEGFGQVVVEAMAAGTPVIGTNHGGIAEIITHEVNGILVPPGDAVALADSIEVLWHDEALRERLVANGLTRATDFTVSAIAPRYLEVYERAIKDNEERMNASGRRMRLLRHESR
jgi:glycosyltransferase involved in cell wall biosynthesis